MSKNIEITILDSNGNYEQLYPKTLMSNITGDLPLSQTSGTLDASKVNNLPKNSSTVVGSYTGTGTTPQIVNFSGITGLTAKALIIAPADTWADETNTNNNLTYDLLHTVLFTKLTNKSNAAGLSNKVINSYYSYSGANWYIKNLTNTSFTLDENGFSIDRNSFFTKKNTQYNYIVFFV